MMKFIKNFFALFIGLVVAFLVLEGFLRIYNPFPIRLKGDKIVLPINQRYDIKNDKIAKLDKEIIHTKNSLGFRGPEMPADYADRLSVITIGGSTTECYYLSDNSTWPYLLGEELKKDYPDIWVNNAGLDGHSTFGHQVLLEDYVVGLKPKMVLFLTGINDVGRDSLNGGFDNRLLRSNYVSGLDWLAKKSEVANLGLNFCGRLKPGNSAWPMDKTWI